MQNNLLTILFIFSILSSTLHAQTWTVEAEDAASSVTWKDGTADIIATKGLTLWCNQLMTGNTVIEYEARITEDPRFLTKEGTPRISDLNCFWMADRMLKKKKPNFIDYYALKLYYMGFGGNWNTTSRFRRYTGDSRGIDSVQYRPLILKEYTDPKHLITPNHWYSVKLEQRDGRVRYYIDGELLVDYPDPTPLTQGYFGFRTTLSHAQFRNFRYNCTDPDNEGIWVKRIAGTGEHYATFGIPFSQGEVTDDNFSISSGKDGNMLTYDTWRLASWPDETAKWQAFCCLIPEGTDSILVSKTKKSNTRAGKAKKKSKTLQRPSSAVALPEFYVTLNGEVTPILSHTTERQGNQHRVDKFTGRNFIIRTYHYPSKGETKMVHTLLVDSTLNKVGLNELSIHFKVPMEGPEYERFVQFDDRNPMHVQPLIARRKIDLTEMDSVTVSMLQNIARWDGFRLSQLSPNGYSIRKRATSLSPWIGTIEGQRSEGNIRIGNTAKSTSFKLVDFWESYPSTLQVDNARSDTAIVTVSLFSPEAEPYTFEHYDTIAHTLEAAYEDVQPGMSTAWGIGRTSTILIGSNQSEDRFDNEIIMCPTPEYLHRKRAFGIWSLPTVEDSRDSLIEATLTGIMQFYKDEIERNGWYGFFNYGDVMHTYDSSRGEWRYDVGGFAWDNTELGTPAMFWYQLLRTGNPDVWRMASAMTRHCSEVDTYHFGPHAGLGSRHNVTHWGCGAKESRISEAWWNRFMFYLTADDRLGDIMDEVVEADTLLYSLDPMRLAQPRSLYPCSAPARLRIGPDWLGYVSNWFTAWERRNNSRFLGKIKAGMTSIANLPHGFFQGPLALGYDPATGIISSDQPELLSTNHLMTIMGGFELICEMQLSISNPTFYDAWLFHCKEYKENALKIRKNKFRIPRLGAYAGWRLGNENLKQISWDDLLGHFPIPQPSTINPQPSTLNPQPSTFTPQPSTLNPQPSPLNLPIFTNDCATWTLDAIFMKETIRK